MGVSRRATRAQDGFRWREKQTGQQHFCQGASESVMDGPTGSENHARYPEEAGLRGRQQLRKDCDEVFPQTIIGTGDCIKVLDFMLDLQITHVVNPCEQEIRFDPTKFAKQGICYKGFICKDMPGENIAQHLADCAEFIDRALSMRCGMVFIASYLGNSRASTIACAYLMLKKGYSATQALQYMRN